MPSSGSLIPPSLRTRRAGAVSGWRIFYQESPEFGTRRGDAFHPGQADLVAFAAELGWQVKIISSMESPAAAGEASRSVSHELTAVDICYRSEARVFSVPAGQVAANCAHSVPGAASTFSAHLSGRRLRGSHIPPLVTRLPGDDAIRGLGKLSTCIGHIARLFAKPRILTTSRRLSGGPFFGHATARKS